MPAWNTQQIIEDLEQVIPNVKNIKAIGQSGDYDTNSIVIQFDGTKDNLFLCGFTPQIKCTTPDNAEVDYVELTDGLDDQGGLKTDDEKVSQAFLAAKKYLRSKKFVVANTIKDFA